MKLISKKKLTNPKYIKPFLIEYEYKGKVRKWEVVEAFSSVAILVFNKERNSLMIVKQPRPALFVNSGGNFLYTYELCAGLLDKGKSEEETAKEELFEEMGIEVEINRLKKITKTYTAVGFAGNSQTIFFVEITNSNIKGKGGGIDGEDIEIISIPIEKIYEFIFDETKPKTPGLMFSFMWFINERIKSGTLRST